MAQRKSRARVDMLLRELEEGFQRPAWHGPNLLGALRRLNTKEVAWRAAPGRHNIWEITLHCAYWKYVVRRRIAGGGRGAFALKGSNWFRCPSEANEAAWKRDLGMLRETHALLCSEVARLSDADLRKLSPRKRYTLEQTIRGAAMHDVYHAGQIQLLKRMYRTRKARSVRAILKGRG